ncbi:MAG: DUF4037 domain-containing protein [Clostridia bacterium]|nr:DUF4037 domain-containing protein [Clostridia bacterium]
MNGLQLSRGYYETYGRPMLERDFPDLLPLLAAGYTGSGSDRCGFDDATSRDHDFEPGFLLFLPDESVIDEKTAFRLERAYAKLPKEYMGVKRQPLSPVGGNRNGVMRTADWFASAVGAPDGLLTVEQWLHIPSHALLEATNGEVFFDGSGAVTTIRDRLKTMPEDIRLKRLAGNLLLMAQAGQYNFTRCLNHGEPEAAMLACHEFVRAALQAVFLLDRAYMPFYKWSFRALRQTLHEEELADKLSILLTAGLTEDAAEDRYVVIEDIASDFIDRLQAEGLTDAICGDLEKHAYSVNDRVKDGELRNMHILAGV